LQTKVPRCSPPTQTDAVDATEPAEDVLWSTARISASELLFGSGEITPGGTARILGMIGPPENLSEQSNVVNIGAGLGGTARAIAIEYDGWVAGYESDPALAAAAMAPERADKVISSSGSGVKASKLNVKVSAKAKIEHADLTKLKLKKKKYDCAVACNALFTVPDKAAVLKKVAASLTPYSELLMTDYFVAEGMEDSPEFHQWIGSEPVPPCLWTIDAFSQVLADSGFELRICDDITDQFRADIVRNFEAFTARCQNKDMPAHQIAPLLQLVDLWVCRVMAMDAGMITMYKLVGLKSR
jgi:SAM-dependent methyltransferase